VAYLPPTLLWAGGSFFAGIAGESSPMMEIEIYVGNLSRSTTEEDLNVLFSQAGDVTSVDVIKDRKSGESNGFAFLTMSAQSEADKAVSMFHAFPLDDHYLRVTLVRPRKQYRSGKI
jgi:RNA recognition motif-containing protein